MENGISERLNKISRNLPFLLESSRSLNEPIISEVEVDWILEFKNLRIVTQNLNNAENELQKTPPEDPFRYRILQKSLLLQHAKKCHRNHLDELRVEINRGRM